MKMRTVRYTREELYGLVWSTPMINLAKQHGLSDRGLAKICKKHKIPCPPRGYWAKRQAGQKVQRIPLPKVANPEPIELRGTVGEKTENSPAERLIEELKVTEVPVKESLRRAHPLIKQISDYYKRVSKKAETMIVAPKEEYLDIKVSPPSIRRALLIMDAVLAILDSKGFSVVIRDSNTLVQMFDVGVKILLKEEYKTVPQKPKDHDLKWNYQFGYDNRKNFQNTERVPSGVTQSVLFEYYSSWVSLFSGGVKCVG